jgi:hypothetical protein
LACEWVVELAAKWIELKVALMGKQWELSMVEKLASLMAGYRELMMVDMMVDHGVAE